MLLPCLVTSLRISVPLHKCICPDCCVWSHAVWCCLQSYCKYWEASDLDSVLPSPDGLAQRLTSNFPIWLPLVWQSHHSCLWLVLQILYHENVWASWADASTTSMPPLSSNRCVESSQQPNWRTSCSRQRIQICFWHSFPRYQEDVPPWLIHIALSSYYSYQWV